MSTGNPVEMNTGKPGPHPKPAMGSTQTTTHKAPPPESSPALENRVIPAAERVFSHSSTSVDQYAVGGLHLTLALLDGFDAGHTAAGPIPAGGQVVMRRFLCGSFCPGPEDLRARATEECLDEVRAVGPELFARFGKTRSPWGAILKVRLPPRRQSQGRPGLSRAAKICTIGPVAARRMELWEEFKAAEMLCRDGGYARADEGRLTAHVWAAIQVAPVDALETLLRALQEEYILWEEADSMLEICGFFLPYLVRSCNIAMPFHRDPSTQDDAEDEPAGDAAARGPAVDAAAVTDDMLESMSQMSPTAQPDSEEARGEAKAAAPKDRSRRALAPADTSRVKLIRGGMESLFGFWGCELVNDFIQALENPQPDDDDIVPPKLRFMTSCMAVLVLTTAPSELFIPEYDTDMEGEWDSD